MSEKEESDSEGGPEYEDDFEKDLDWLINEEEKQHATSQNEDENEDLTEERSNNTKPLVKEENKGDHILSSDDDITQAVPNMNSKLTLDTVSESEEVDPEDEEAKRYIAEKIEEANKKLEMETINENRKRKLKFKDNLVDLEVPPLDFPDSDKTESNSEDDAVDGMTELHLDDVPAKEESNLEENEKTDEEPKDGKVLVEKDGKFELVSLKEIENQCSLPPISNNKELLKSPSPSLLSGRFGGLPNGDDYGHMKSSSVGNVNNFMPQPPDGPKARPSSATHSLKSIHKVKPSRRVQSASVSTRNTTFSLSPEQKELHKRMQERQERLRREEEDRKREEEEQKRRENETAFKVWLQKKDEQLIQEKRIQQAKELERSSTSEKEKETPDEAFTVWLKRKHKEQVKEKKMEELRQQETTAFLDERKDREGAFAQWLKQKRIQKRVEEQAAKERSRKLLLEARRNKQIHNLMYNISDSRSLRYIDPYS
ncbi:coiled-coil domain-containing protein 181 [Mantella aurantiaca]